MPKVIVPATTANLGAGFDSLGMALCLFNEVEYQVTSYGLKIHLSDEEKEFIAADERNLVYRAIERGLREINIGMPGLVLRQKNDIPRTRGLGSSAACVVAGLHIANDISGGQLSKHKMIQLAAEIEGHPDNILPAILGGLTVGCMDGDLVRYAKIEPPDRLKCCLLIPPYTVSTKRARSSLPQEVTLSDAVFNLSRSALLVAAMANGDLSLLDTATQDKLHQSYRAKLIPRYGRTVKAAMQNGALGCFISGSGSALIAFVNANYSAFLQSMQQELEGFGWRIELVSHSREGARIFD